MASLTYCLDVRFEELIIDKLPSMSVVPGQQQKGYSACPFCSNNRFIRLKGDHGLNLSKDLGRAGGEVIVASFLGGCSTEDGRDEKAWRDKRSRRNVQEWYIERGVYNNGLGENASATRKTMRNR